MLEHSEHTRQGKVPKIVASAKERMRQARVHPAVEEFLDFKTNQLQPAFSNFLTSTETRIRQATENFRIATEEKKERIIRIPSVAEREVISSDETFIARTYLETWAMKGIAPLSLLQEESQPPVMVYRRKGEDTFIIRGEEGTTLRNLAVNGFDENHGFNVIIEVPVDHLSVNFGNRAIATGDSIVREKIGEVVCEVKDEQDTINVFARESLGTVKATNKATVVGEKDAANLYADDATIQLPRGEVTGHVLATHGAIVAVDGNVQQVRIFEQRTVSLASAAQVYVGGKVSEATISGGKLTAEGITVLTIDEKNASVVADYVQSAAIAREDQLSTESIENLQIKR